MNITHLIGNDELSFSVLRYVWIKRANLEYFFFIISVILLKTV